MRVPSFVQRDHPLAPYTSLALGGPAEFFCQASSRAELQAACSWAKSARVPLTVLAGGSNVVVADAGVPGLVVHLVWPGVEVLAEGEGRTLVAAAGTPLDQLVALTVQEGWQGLECLSGIPGSVGAAPVQNVGAYGQEIAQVLLWVEALHRQNLSLQRFAPSQCGFAYRQSRFRQATPWIITRVALRLCPGGFALACHPELSRLLGTPRGTPSLSQVREAVLTLRRAKGMLLDPHRPLPGSVGSFFKNPVLSPKAWESLKARLWAQGVLPPGEAPPHMTLGEGIKVAAAWLMEQAGFARGLRHGAVGISPHHALALVHWGGGTTQALLDLASAIQQRVEQTFGISLEPEPIFFGFGSTPPLRHAVTL
ncbi:MAG: UDP-N-acetylmuramate dehydrogenase [Thermoanaerobaculum sp.]|nr:UDP-N-acetylmuramate dehydrogenase [Thermoanaerobaculum sp.]MDW7967350.1 UDP-N-acetylmuramate dehydrogenase [Thermoanaerobaculum sp.]